MTLKNTQPRFRLDRWRRTLAAGITLAMIGVAAGCAATGPTGPAASGDPAAEEAPAGKIQIVVGAPVTIQALPVFAAAQGLFEDEGLDVSVELITAAQVPTALAGGTAQFSISAATGPDAAALEAPIKILGTYAPKPNMQLLLGEGIDSIADLEGKSLGVSAPGEIVDSLARIALRDAGLDPDEDVTIVPLGSFQAVLAAFQTGQVDAVVVSTQPTAAMLLSTTPGSSVGYAFAESTDWTYGGLYANTEWTDAHPEATQKVVNAINNAVKEWWANPEAVQATLVEFAHSEDPVADYEAELSVMTETLEPVTEASQIAALTALKENGHPDLDPQDWATYVDNSFVENLE